VGNSSYQLVPDQSLVAAISITGKTDETQKLFDRVSGYTDLRMNVYTVPVIDSKVNVEICPGDVNYIVYNAAWVKALYEETNNMWVLYAVIAHEVGHYVRNHDRTATGSNINIELEADEYAGEVLAKMGASLEDAQAAFKSEKMQSHSHTHPPLDQRLSAVRQGWLRGAGTHRSANPIRNSDVGSINIGRTGSIAGLEGSLNPKLDKWKRTYLYADNIAINGGEKQPVSFTLNQPLRVEDSLGNQFELRITSITEDSSTIEYTRTSDAQDLRSADFDVQVVNENSRPVNGAEVSAIFADGTHIKGTTDSSGIAHIQKLKQSIVTLYCAHPNYQAFYKKRHIVGQQLLIGLQTKAETGSVIIERTGHVPGLNGLLNPKLDSHDRMYLYAVDISIENGKKQPADFVLNQPFQVEDAQGNRFQLKIVAIIAGSSLVEFTQLH